MPNNTLTTNELSLVVKLDSLLLQHAQLLCQLGTLSTLDILGTPLSLESTNEQSRGNDAVAGDERSERVVAECAADWWKEREVSTELECWNSEGNIPARGLLSNALAMEA